MKTTISKVMALGAITIVLTLPAHAAGSGMPLVCPQQSGPLFELVPASEMELRHGQEIEA